ncbi:UPF0042 nucleotide-binding protein [Stella humosa]|uniref:UPF0042 nucleotide-binding protein n=1 Tax=Stella humosa TaxID=94 RepID=A0A3N1KQR3_9PROT|nr:RNase adapter RapZ [Stella humosa]ROP84143.1 UPF0042 nucleotide-binding protein [Stella humosa]
MTRDNDPSDTGRAVESRPDFDGEQDDRPRVVIVTGLSGAGRTTALRALEDLGYEAVDNPPLALLAGLLHADAPAPRPMVIGIDVRTRDFATPTSLALLDRIASEGGRRITLLFLDCEDEVLGRRFTETRRRHPLAVDRPVLDGIRREREIVWPLRRRADLVLDTTALPPAELKRILEGHFALNAAPRLAISVMSFSYRQGLPREADLVIDVRFLDNPHYDPVLRPLTGRDPAVGARVAADPDFAAFFDGLTGWLAPLLPRYAHEGKSYLTIAIGCTGGKHRSVYCAERLSAWLAATGMPARLHHRDVDRAS